MPPSDLPPPVNHVFVDCENVHVIDTKVIGEKAVNFTLLYGPTNAKFDVAVVETLIKHSASVQIIRLTSSGKDALDLALAYYLGRCVLADPTAFFHIISKDTGFDPLIEHLRSRHFNVRRHTDFTSLTFSYQAKTAPPPAQTETLLSRVVETLRKTSKNRPKTKKTLLALIRHLSGGTATEKEISGVFGKLGQDGQVKVGTKTL
jgi:hypothetical protein